MGKSWVCMVAKEWKRKADGKSWMGVWRSERGNFIVEREKECREQPNSKLFQISQYVREFHKTYVNKGRGKIISPLKVCVSSKGVTISRGILCR